MPKLPRWTAREAEQAMREAGFELIRSRGSHRIYRKGKRRIVLPHHSGKILHPKIIRQVVRAINQVTEDT